MAHDVSTLPAQTRIGQIALRISDPSPMIEFYRDVVGLAVHRERESVTILGDGEHPLLVLEHDVGATARPRDAAGLYHTAFRVPSRAALGDALARIREEWNLDGASDHGVSEALYLADPEGNGVEIYRDYPRSEWPETAEGDVRIWTERLELSRVRDAAAGRDGAPVGTDIGHVHLEVTSLETFTACYVETLGFDMRVRMPHAAFVAAGGYHHHIGANTWRGRTAPASGRGLSWFEVVVPDSSHLAALRDRLSASPYSVSETDDGFALGDPDEIEVRFRVEPA